MSGDQVLRLLAELTSGAVLAAGGPVDEHLVLEDGRDGSGVSMELPTVSARPPAPGSRWRATAWPENISNLGPRRIVAYTPCADCAQATCAEDVVIQRRDAAGDQVAAAVEPPVGTWCTFGDLPLCQAHARARVADGNKAGPA
jgi:hypothetical protein